MHSPVHPGDYVSVTTLLPIYASMCLRDCVNSSVHPTVCIQVSVPACIYVTVCILLCIHISIYHLYFCASVHSCVFVTVWIPLCIQLSETILLCICLCAFLHLCSNVSKLLCASFFVSTCLCICVYAFVHPCVYVSVCNILYIHESMCLYVCIHVSMGLSLCFIASMCLSECAQSSVHPCVYASLSVLLCSSICLCDYIHRENEGIICNKKAYIKPIKAQSISFRKDVYAALPEGFDKFIFWLKILISDERECSYRCVPRLSCNQMTGRGFVTRGTSIVYCDIHMKIYIYRERYWQQYHCHDFSLSLRLLEGVVGLASF